MCASASAARISELAKVHIYRENRAFGAALTPTVFLGDLPLVNIASGSAYQGFFPPGEYIVRMDDRRTGVKLKLEPGSAHYMKVEIVPGFWAGAGKLTYVLPEQGEYEVQGLGETSASDIKQQKFTPRVAERDMRAISQWTVDEYNTRRRFPKALPARIDGVKLVDPWGTPYRYVVAADGQSYTLACAGTDLVFDEGSWNATGALEDLDEDFVIRGENGTATYIRRWNLYPKR